MIILEREWLVSGEPEKCLAILEGKASKRKIALFHCAGIRRLWPLLSAAQRRYLLAIEQKAETLTVPASRMDLYRPLVPLWGEEYEPLPRSFTGEGERWKQTKLLRDIFGPLPFRAITIDSASLSWHGGLLVSMAQQMYDSRDFTDMPILADALEEAGCTEPDILLHCRKPGEHVRGCWVVDLFLGKE